MDVRQEVSGGTVAQTNSVRVERGGAGSWIFRVLLVAAAAFMIFTWFAPWWSGTLAVLPGEDHLVMRPWGVEVTAQVRTNSDASLYSMPWFFGYFMWTYLAVCMLALAASLFVNRRISLRWFSLPLATVLIGLVGLSYMFAVGTAYAVGELRAGWADVSFIGESTIRHSETGNRLKMESSLKIGYWLALGAGGALFFLALIRGLIARNPKA